MSDEEPKYFKGKPGPGRGKGTPNKTTTILKEAILEAAKKAGGEGGMVAYLVRQAEENPAQFLSLLGKVLPFTITSDPTEPMRMVIEWQKPE